MIGFNGGLIGKTRTYASTGANSGVWSLDEILPTKRNVVASGGDDEEDVTIDGVTYRGGNALLLPPTTPSTTAYSIRIRLSNGFTRYAHQPPTAEEILDAGYVAYTEPAYDAATEQLLWVDGAYVIEALPPPIPTPRWVDFSAIVMSLPAINVMLGAVLQAAPGLYGGLVVGLQNASEGDSRVFLNSWNAAFAMGLLSAELITTVQEIAAEYDLPEVFIEALAPA
jgi:hypothetical protein